jgi:hypothetical protein
VAAERVAARAGAERAAAGLRRVAAGGRKVPRATLLGAGLGRALCVHGVVAAARLELVPAVLTAAAEGTVVPVRAGRASECNRAVRGAEGHRVNAARRTVRPSRARDGGSDGEQALALHLSCKVQALRPRRVRRGHHQDGEQRRGRGGTCRAIESGGRGVNRDAPNR